jgi:hypothetical protein
VRLHTCGEERTHILGYNSTVRRAAAVAQASSPAILTMSCKRCYQPRTELSEGEQAQASAIGSISAEEHAAPISL